MSETFSFTVSAIDEGLRVDEFLAEQIGISRSQIKQRAKDILVDGRQCKLSRKLTAGACVVCLLEPEAEPELVPQDIPLSIIYEDEFCIVIDKPQGLVVHPGAGNPDSTLANALAYRFFSVDTGEELDDAADYDLRPGIVHRLDKDTSGVLLAAKNKQAQEFFASCFRDRLVKKQYLAIVRGIPDKKKGSIKGWIRRSRRNRKKFELVDFEGAGKFSETYYRVLSSYKTYSLVSLYPHTGRTHQLRVHMAHIGCPILGDPLYSRRDANFKDATLMLHAYRLSVPMPDKGGIAVFRAALPERFKTVLNLLASKSI